MAIELKPKKTVSPEQKERKEKAVQKIPFHALDSAEVDFIRQKIKKNREYLASCTNAGAYKKVEADTLFLENNILPILLAKTNLFFNDSVKEFVCSLDKSVQANCNAMLYYAPIKDEYEDFPLLSKVNSRSKPDKLDTVIHIFAVPEGENCDMFEEVAI